MSDWLDGRGSTRPVGLLRILLPLIAWSRWGNEILPCHDVTPTGLALSAAFFATTTWMLIGWYGRAATAATGAVLIVMVYGFGRAGLEDWDHHHTTLLADLVALLALTPCSTSFSLDRWLELGRAERAGLPPPPEIGPTWANRLIALQISTVYFWSAFDKTSIPFLSGLRLEQIFVQEYWTSDFHAGPIAHALFALASIAAVATEYALAFGLWIPRLRGPLALVGVALHAAFYVLLPVETFSVTMVAAYLAILDPDAIHRFLDRWMGPAR